MEKSTFESSSTVTPYNVFPKILTGELPASFVYRDELVSAFMDVQPITPGHMLVIPNEAAENLAELVPDCGAHMFRVAQRLAAGIRATRLRCEGVNLILADGQQAGQTVFYAHLHVIPRYTGDGFGINFPDDYQQRPPRDELEANAALIRAALDT